jgi:hypothetical protein
VRIKVGVVVGVPCIEVIGLSCELAIVRGSSVRIGEHLISVTDQLELRSRRLLHLLRFGAVAIGVQQLRPGPIGALDLLLCRRRRHS